MKGNRYETFGAIMAGVIAGRILAFYFPNDSPFDLWLNVGLTALSVGILLALGRPKGRCQSVASIGGIDRQCHRRTGHYGRHEIDLKEHQ